MIAHEQTFVVGLPVIVTVRTDGSVIAEVDFSELTDEMSRNGANPDVVDHEGVAPHVPPLPEVLTAVEEWVDTRTALVVSWPRTDVAPDTYRCPCGAPVATWRTKAPDGDSEPHGHCLNASCAQSTY